LQPHRGDGLGLGTGVRLGLGLARGLAKHQLGQAEQSTGGSGLELGVTLGLGLREMLGLLVGTGLGLGLGLELGLGLGLGLELSLGLKLVVGMGLGLWVLEADGEPDTGLGRPEGVTGRALGGGLGLSVTGLGLGTSGHRYPKELPGVAFSVEKAYRWELLVVHDCVLDAHTHCRHVGSLVHSALQLTLSGTLR